ncbi:hypothetical protein GTO36_00060 [bacterium]|nr:hypothetical protein [bacterium]
MRKTKNSLKIIAILCVFLFHLSCYNEIGVDDKSGVVLIITRIIGSDEQGRDADYLASDVITDDGGYETDPVIITVEAKLKKPVPIVPGGTYKTSIMIDRYYVTFTSPEGDPVPPAFEGRLAAVCEVDSSLDIEVVIVRAEAKTLPPLSTLVGTTNAIWAVAEIRLVGHDLNGEGVEATGYLTVYFANWVES